MGGSEYMYDKIKNSLNDQTPRQEEATYGLLCDSCDMGPCKFNISDRSNSVPCGITPDEMALKNLAEKIIEGLGEYKSSTRHLTTTYSISTLIEKAANIIPPSISYTSKMESLLSKNRETKKVPFGLGGLREDAINVCAIATPQRIYDLVIAAKNSGLCKKALEAGSTGINIVSLGYPGAEVTYQLGVPCIGNYLVLDDALQTGCIDSIFSGGNTTESILAAIKSFEGRKDNIVQLPKETLHKTGMNIESAAINEAYKTGSIQGAVVIFGASSPTCTWDMQSIVDDLTAKDFLVFVTGAHMYKGNKNIVMDSSVLHIGFCEVGKIYNMGLNFKPTILVPGWKNAKILTSSLAMAHENYRVIMGLDIPVTRTIKKELASNGFIVEKDGGMVMRHILNK